MVTFVVVTTALVVIGKVCEVAPEGTVTLEGTDATVEMEDESATTNPVEGAAPLSVTVPVAVPLAPPVTLLGLTEKETRLGRIVTESDGELLFSYVPDVSVYTKLKSCKPTKGVDNVTEAIPPDMEMAELTA